MTLAETEFVDNPESRCPVVLLLDVSESMAGIPIQELTAGLATFKYHVEEDPLAALRVDLAIITFGEEATLFQDFKTIDLFTAPVLTAQGNTPMGKALEMGLSLIEERKKAYKTNGISYYRPWIFLITDGAPTDGMLWYEKAQEVQRAEQEGKLSFFAVGVKGADMSILSQIAPDHRPPYSLKELKFKELFQWLSASIRCVSTSQTKKSPEALALPSVTHWAQGIGRT